MGIIVAILASLILYILVRGLPHISLVFLDWKSSSYQAGGGSAFSSTIPFPFGHYLDYFCSLSMGAGFSKLSMLKRSCYQLCSDLVLKSCLLYHQCGGSLCYLIFVVQFEYGFSIISGALALTVFNLPQMTRNVEDSLKHVHHTQREAGLALGISRWETVVHVVIPEALPGIVTGVVLASGRIFGEAAVLSIQQDNPRQPLTGLTGISSV